MTHFYEQDGKSFVPSILARSPWDRQKQNGVALAGLLAHLMEGIPAPQPMMVARFGVDILSGAPLAPLTGCCRILRDGKRIQLVQSELLADDRVVARGTALRVRNSETLALAAPNPYPPPEDFVVSNFLGITDWAEAAETREAPGTPHQGRVWVRLSHEHVAGVKMTPLVRAAILGDFPSGLDRSIPIENWTFANLDITLHMTRLPEGEWVFLEGGTSSAGNGIGIANAIMADRLGSFGSCHQTLFIAPRAHQA